jgi:PAS domain-containing protein
MDNLLVFSNIFIASAFFSLILVLYVVMNRKVLALYKTLGVLFFAVSIWSLFYGLELRATEYSSVSLYLKFQYIGITIIPLFWFRFALKYIGKIQWVKPGRFLILSIIPIVTLLMVITNDYHHLFYEESFLSKSETGHFHEFVPGIFYFIHIGYSYLLIFLAIVMLISAFFTVSRDNRSRLIVFILSSTIPFILSGIYVIGIRPEGNIDLTPIGFLVMAFIMLTGVLNTRLMEVKPLMINNLFDHLPAAVFATDINRSIISMNSKARKMVEEGVMSEMKIRELADMDNYVYLTENDAYVTEFESDGQVFRVHRAMLLNHKKESDGYLYLIYNVTREKRYQESLRFCESKYQFLFTVSHEGILVIRDKNLVSANPVMEKLTRYSNGELTSMSVFDVIYDEDILLMNNLLNRMKYTAVAEKAGTIRLKTKENSPVYVKYSILNTEWDGEEAYVMFVIPS